LATMYEIYNGYEALTNKDFIRVTNYIFPFLKRLNDENIISLDRSMILSSILTFKTSKENPSVSISYLSKLFDVSEKAIKNAIRDLKESLLVRVIKKGRKNYYDLTPFLNALALFVEAFKAGEDINIRQLVKAAVTGEKEAKKAEKVHTETQPKQQKTQPSNDIKETLDDVQIDEYLKDMVRNMSIIKTDSERVKVARVIESYNGVLHEATIITYLNRLEKEIKPTLPANYLRTCLDNEVRKVYNKEKSKNERVAPNGVKIVRWELLPDWFDGHMKNFNNYCEKLKEVSKEEVKQEVKQEIKQEENPLAMEFDLACEKNPLDALANLYAANS
jgi:predicted transcriptional regulator